MAGDGEAAGGGVNKINGGKIEGAYFGRVCSMF